jgi:hypothetical protein
VKSLLPDPMAVLLTVAQNRFLLNSLRGEGFLNVRLTTQEAKEAVGIDPIRQLFTGCIQTEPCLASAISLARCLARPRSGVALRDADFVRHEAVMSMLQYRHKSRAWLQMVTADDNGNFRQPRRLLGEPNTAPSSQLAHQ